MTEYFKVPEPYNEEPKTYAPGSPEKNLLKQELMATWSRYPEIPMYIDGKERTSSELVPIKSPDMHSHILGHFFKAGKDHVQDAIDAALRAKFQWGETRFEERVRILLKMANLLTSDYRQKINAATMLGQNKNVYQSEIDAVCELADFWRYNPKFAQEIYQDQPLSTKEAINTMEYHPLEGFVYALSPFNFTSIGGNLPLAPILMGNTVVWKPSNQEILSAQVIMEIANKAGLPEGVLNLIYPPGLLSAEVIFKDPDFAGLHFTGSTDVYYKMHDVISKNIRRYRSFPRIVAETGGKDFILVHESADPLEAAVGIVRAGFELQGQKCSAASRIYLPAGFSEEVLDHVFNFVSKIKVGGPMDFTNFMCAVIDEAAFNKITGYIKRARKSDRVKMLWDGGFDKSEGYFIKPTIIQALDPHYESMEQEIFGPVLSVYVYKSWEEVLPLINKTSPYGLTGSVFANDMFIIRDAQNKLRYGAGNFYINDKPTGAVVGQQPFGGARHSGTNDKAGSKLNLLKWVSPRTIKENLNPPTDINYPHMAEQ